MLRHLTPLAFALCVGPAMPGLATPCLGAMAPDASAQAAPTQSLPFADSPSLRRAVEMAEATSRIHMEDLAAAEAYSDCDS